MTKLDTEGVNVFDLCVVKMFEERQYIIILNKFYDICLHNQSYQHYNSYEQLISALNLFNTKKILDSFSLSYHTDLLNISVLYNHKQFQNFLLENGDVVELLKESYYYSYNIGYYGLKFAYTIGFGQSIINLLHDYICDENSLYYLWGARSHIDFTKLYKMMSLKGPMINGELQSSREVVDIIAQFLFNKHYTRGTWVDSKMNKFIYKNYHSDKGILKSDVLQEFQIKGVLNLIGPAVITSFLSSKYNEAFKDAVIYSINSENDYVKNYSVVLLTYFNLFIKIPTTAIVDGAKKVMDLSFELYHYLIDYHDDGNKLGFQHQDDSDNGIFGSAFIDDF